MSPGSSPKSICPINLQPALGARHADSFADLADRRSWLSRLTLPANDSEIALVLAWPTLRRLHRAGQSVNAKALAQWCHSGRPMAWPTDLQAANDDAPEKYSAGRVPYEDELDVERIREIRPTINELMSAAWRVSVTSTRRTRWQWTPLKRRALQLEFRQARLVAYFKAGRRYIAKDGLRGEKGGTAEKYSAVSVARYLSIGGVPNIEQWATHDGGRHVEPTPAKTTARQILQELGVDGSVACADLSYPAKKLPTGLATDGHWLGGRVASTGKGGAPSKWINIWDEVERISASGSVRAQMQPDDVELLDLATTPLTARQIGEQFGRRGKSAERWAVLAVDNALAKIAA